MAIMISANITPALNAPSTSPQPDKEIDSIKRAVMDASFLIVILMLTTGIGW
jgi:hypothetical protein